LTTLPPPAISTTLANQTPEADNDDAEIDEPLAFIPPRVVLESSESEEEGTPRPGSSASRAHIQNGPGNENAEEERTVPSVVADRTRMKSKAAASPEEASENQRDSDDGDDYVPTKKRKVEGEERASPIKRPRAAATKVKAAATRKPAGKR
jgi:hypothetical protein